MGNDAYTIGPEEGIIVSDLYATGYNRGTYKVFIPKRHPHISLKSNYTRIGANLNELDASDLAKMRAVAEECWPIFPLESGGSMPIDPATCIVSTDETNNDISSNNTAYITNSGITKPSGYHSAGNGIGYYIAQTDGANEFTQINYLDTRSGYITNTREGAAHGNFAKLTIGTWVQVMGHTILGMLPETQNDWINTFKPLNNQE